MPLVSAREFIVYLADWLRDFKRVDDFPMSRPKPPGDFTLEQIEALRPLAKLVGLFSKDLHKQFAEVEIQVQNVKNDAC